MFVEGMALLAAGLVLSHLAWRLTYGEDNSTPLGVVPPEKLADCVAPKLEPAPPNVTSQQILQVHQAGRTLGRREMLNQLYNPVLN